MGAIVQHIFATQLFCDQLFYCDNLVTNQIHIIMSEQVSCNCNYVTDKVCIVRK